MCRYPFDILNLIPLDTYPGVELLGHKVDLFLSFSETARLLPQRLDQFTFLATVEKGSLSSTSLPTFVILCLFFIASLV